MRKFTIHKAKPFYKAGQMFGWKGAGIGIDQLVLNNCFEDDVIEVLLQTKKPYYITAQRVRDLVKQYNSWHNVRGIRVAIVPFSELKGRVGVGITGT